jgi:hypothetical protein
MARATIAETPKDKIRADQMTSYQQAFDHQLMKVLCNKQRSTLRRRITITDILYFIQHRNISGKMIISLCLWVTLMQNATIN